MVNQVRVGMRRVARGVQAAWASRKRERLTVDLSLSQAAGRFPSRNDLHGYMHHYFYNLAPELLREHRRYFSQEGRGFGEDIFHAMWYLLFREFQPQNCLEIGIYRGQIISLWALIAKHLGMRACEVHGISPFSASGDAVSSYGKQIDYYSDVLENHAYFDLPKPRLLKAYSTDSAAINYIRSQEWSLIYIDGNHDYEVAKADYDVCVGSLADGGILVMDDSSLYTDFAPPLYSFAGHPGPSRVVQERAMKELIFVAGVGHNNVFMKPHS